MEHILVIEDDPAIRDLLRRGLTYENYKVTTANDGASGLTAARDFPPDLVILDWMMPGLDGLEVCMRLRAASNVPILMLTAKDSVPDRVLGLESGADDYLVKPFATAELEARVRALIRRGHTPTSPQIALGPLTLDLVARRARLADEPLELTVREWGIIELLATQPGVALSKERIVQSLSSWDEKLSQNAVEVYVSRLRAKLEPCGVQIRTVRGFGYLLETPRGA